MPDRPIGDRLGDSERRLRQFDRDSLAAALNVILTAVEYAIDDTGDTSNLIGHIRQTLEHVSSPPRINVRPVLDVVLSEYLPLPATAT